MTSKTTQNRLAADHLVTVFFLLQVSSLVRSGNTFHDDAVPADNYFDMDEVIAKDRRLHRRYIVPGTVELHTAFGHASAELINIGQGGMLIRSSLALPQQSELTIHASLPGYPHTLKASVQVAGAKDGQIAITFLKEPNGLCELLLWLARENAPWAATYPVSSSDSVPPQPPALEKSTRQLSEKELEDLRAYLHQLG